MHTSKRRDLTTDKVSPDSLWLCLLSLSHDSSSICLNLPVEYRLRAELAMGDLKLARAPILDFSVPVLKTFPTQPRARCHQDRLGIERLGVYSGGAFCCA